MKKSIIIIIILFLFTYKSIQTTEPVLNEVQNDNYYELIFNNELLNFRDFKLKLATFSSHEYNIMKVYIDYPENIKSDFDDKQYFSFDNSNLSIGLEKLKNEYVNSLEERHLYNEIDKDINETKISKVEIYADTNSINIFRKKYPLVKINQINNKKF